MKQAVKWIYRIPILGWMLKSAVRGDEGEKIFFILNLVMIWVLAIGHFGFPALILPALFAAGAMLLFLVVFTAADLLDG